MTQFSLFGAEAAEPDLADLAGVLFAGGHWVRAGEDGAARARLSVVVADRWRADALADEFDRRGFGPAADSDRGDLTGPHDPTTVAAEGGYSVRTPFTAGLIEQARRWSRGTRVAAPADLTLTAAGLRLWAVAAGRKDDSGYLLGTARAGDDLHTAAGAQLARLGLAAVAIGPRGGPGWRIASIKRVRRLAELVGVEPDGAAGHWPLPR